MAWFSVPMETIYLYGLFVGGGLSLLYIFFSDALDGLLDFDPTGIFSPANVLSLVTTWSAGGYLLEHYTGLTQMVIAGISAVLAFFTVSILHLFVFIPLRSAETSLSFHTADLAGRVGRVIIPIPVDGFGEILLEDVTGSLAKTAKSFENREIPFDARVLIIEMDQGVAVVTPYEPGMKVNL